MVHGQVMVGWWGGVAKSQDGRQRASVLILEAMPLAGYGAIFEAWSHARAREGKRWGMLLESAASTVGLSIHPYGGAGMVGRVGVVWPADLDPASAIWRARGIWELSGWGWVLLMWIRGRQDCQGFPWSIPGWPVPGPGVFGRAFQPVTVTLSEERQRLTRTCPK
jgi:hypothetical protein